MILEKDSYISYLNNKKLYSKIVRLNLQSTRLTKVKCVPTEAGYCLYFVLSSIFGG